MAKKGSALKGGVSAPPPPASGRGTATNPELNYVYPKPAGLTKGQQADAARLTAQALAAGLTPTYNNNPNLGGGGVYVPPAPKPPRDKASPITAPAGLSWKNLYTQAGAPAFWQGLVPSRVTTDTAYAGLINALIPFMSPEDQQSMAGSLFRFDPEAFSAYNPELLNVAAPTEIGTDTRRQFSSTDRGQGILDALETFRATAGVDASVLGPGYSWLRSVADSLRDKGGTSENAQTRAQNAQLRGQLDVLFGEAGSGALAPYEPVARALATPFFSAGQLTPVARTQDGTFVFGQANRELF